MHCLKYFILFQLVLPCALMADGLLHPSFFHVGSHEYFLQRFADSARDYGVMHLQSVRGGALGMDAEVDGQLPVKKPVKPKRFTMLDGRDVFVRQCMQCHLASDQTAPQLAHAEDWSWRVKSGVDFLVRATISGKPYHEDPPHGLLGLSSEDRYNIDQVQTVPTRSSDQRVRGCEVPRGGCADCSDAEIIAVVKYMMQAAATDNANYSLW